MSAKNDIPYGYCHCGCGEKTAIAVCSNKSRGHVRGEPLRFCHGHNSRVENPYRRQGPDYVVSESGCWEWQHACAPNGYGVVQDPSKGRRVQAHRLYYERANGPVPEGLELDHLCRNRACVNPDHLEPVTRAENLRRGAGTKLTSEQVAAIRVSGRDDYSLAAEYGVTYQHIGRLKRGQHWAGV